MADRLCERWWVSKIPGRQCKRMRSWRWLVSRRYAAALLFVYPTRGKIREPSAASSQANRRAKSGWFNETRSLPKNMWSRYATHFFFLPRLKISGFFGLLLSLHLIDKLGHTYLHMLVVCRRDLKIPGAHIHELSWLSILVTITTLGSAHSLTKLNCRLSFHVCYKSLSLWLIDHACKTIFYTVNYTVYIIEFEMGDVNE